MKKTKTITAIAMISSPQYVMAVKIQLTKQTTIENVSAFFITIDTMFRC